MPSPSSQFTEVVTGLYAYTVVSPVSPTHVYFLAESTAQKNPGASLDQIWDDAGWDGWLLYLPGPIADPAGFVAKGRQKLPDLGQTSLLNRRGIVWLPGEAGFGEAQFLLTYKQTPQAKVRGFLDNMSISLAPLSIEVPVTAGAALALDTQTATFTIVGPTGNQNININGLGDPKFYGSETQWALNFGLEGENAGAITQAAAFEFLTLVQNLGCAIRYVKAVGGQAVPLEYPLFETPQLNRFRGMRVSLHPLFPELPGLSSILFDYSSSVPAGYCNDDLVSDSFRTIDGSSIIAYPIADNSLPLDEQPGFALCKGPIPDSPAGDPPRSQFYLSPIGKFTISGIDRADGSPDPRQSHNWMCGLSGQEYLNISSGLQFQLITGGAAFSADRNGGSPSNASSNTAHALADDFTTSRVIPPYDPMPGPKQSYFGQANASTYYLGQDQFGLSPPAVSLLAEFYPSEPVPMVPYGRVFQDGINVSVSADIFQKIESGALAKDRHSILTAGQSGPRFSAHATSGAIALAGEAHNSALTPQGFVAELNDDGSWSQVNLARSPDPGHEAQKLSFSSKTSPPEVPSKLATTLLQNQLFLVVSQRDALGEFADELALDGFNFVLDVGPTGQGNDSPDQVTDNETILIFKYNNSASLADLAKSTEAWAETQTFVRDPEGTRAQILSSIEQAQSKQTLSHHDEVSVRFAANANPAPPNPLANFARIAADPAWTGVIALNALIDANGMPPDLQMLLGGINGALRAHHFGIASSQIDTTGGTVEIKQSSLFGVIDYPSATHKLPPVDTTDPFDYEVVKLNVVFSNSKIETFNVRVGLTVNQLFGREVQLVQGKSSPQLRRNTLEIAGRYQVQNGVGAVSFFTDKAFVYEFPVPDGTSRVLEQVTFDSASLVPVSHEPMGSAGTRVHCRFGLAGSMWFNQEPFDTAPGLDLFSYGTGKSNGIGQNFNGVAVDIKFDLDHEGGLAAGSKTVTGNLEKMTVSSNTDAARDGSLMHNLPLKISKFLSDTDGLSGSKLGATPVHVVQLEPAPANVKTSPVVSPLLPATGPAPNVTTKPHYAMEFDMPLGSLGALSNVHAGLTAKLLLGWGPSTVVPETDAAAVLVQLPSAFAGYGGFELQGILKTTFGDANLLKVDLHSGTVYAVLFGNIKLSFLGYDFPPGLAVDFLLFAGDSGKAKGGSNIAWFLGAKQEKKAKQ